MPSKSTYRKAIIEVEFASAEEKWKAFEKLNKSKGGDIFDMLENPLK